MTSPCLPSHLFVGSSDGALYDARHVGWSERPLRRNYEKQHKTIESVADLKAALRYGQYVWPGGYPCYFITTDGGALTFGTVRKELRRVMEAVAGRHVDSGWCVCVTDVNYEDEELYDDHTGEKIESAYGG